MMSLYENVVAAFAYRSTRWNSRAGRREYNILLSYQRHSTRQGDNVNFAEEISIPNNNNKHNYKINNYNNLYYWLKHKSFSFFSVEANAADEL